MLSLWYKIKIPNSELFKNLLWRIPNVIHYFKMPGEYKLIDTCCFWDASQIRKLEWH